jgi:hypothetical protein
MINIFNKKETDAVIARINKLTPDSKPLWGKMSVDQMLAHCNVSYELAYENMHPKPNALMKLFMKLVAKQMVVNETPYKKNLRTAPVFIIADHKNFEAERKRLIAYIKKTQELGADHFDGRESHSFGKLTKSEWNNMFAKHLDHHLTQFGV